MTLAQRVDRQLLLSLYEQSRQILMVKLNLWGAIENEHERLPQTSDILKKGVDFMTGIATKYAAGEILRADLKKYRDENLLATAVVQQSTRTQAHAQARKAEKATRAANKKTQSEADLGVEDRKDETTTEPRIDKPTTTVPTPKKRPGAAMETKRPTKAAATNERVAQSSSSFLETPPSFDSMAAFLSC